MKQKLPRLYGITVWDLRPLLSCCWGYSLGLFFWIFQNCPQACDFHPCLTEQGTFAKTLQMEPWRSPRVRLGKSMEFWREMSGALGPCLDRTRCPDLSESLESLTQCSALKPVHMLLRSRTTMRAMNKAYVPFKTLKTYSQAKTVLRLIRISSDIPLCFTYFQMQSSQSSDHCTILGPQITAPGLHGYCRRMWRCLPKCAVHIPPRCLFLAGTGHRWHSSWMFIWYYICLDIYIWNVWICMVSDLLNKRTVGSIQFSDKKWGSKELHAEILHYTYDIHDHCLPRDLATGFLALLRTTELAWSAWGSGAYHEIFLMQGWMARFLRYVNLSTSMRCWVLEVMRWLRKSRSWDPLLWKKSLCMALRTCRANLRPHFWYPDIICQIFFHALVTASVSWMQCNCAFHEPGGRSNSTQQRCGLVCALRRPGSSIQMSNVQNLGWLMIIGDYTHTH